MNDFPPNTDPKLATLSAVTIGLALVGNYSAAEQNAIGNWFITIGQVLLNTSAWQAMIESRISGNTLNINSKEFKESGDPYMNNRPWCSSPTNKEIERLKNVVRIMQEELDKMK